MRNFTNSTRKSGKMWPSTSDSAKKNIKIVTDALIYNYAFNCLFAQVILSPDKLLKSPSHQILSRIFPKDHKVITNISSSSLVTVISFLPANHRCVHNHFSLYERHSHSHGPIKSKTPTVTPGYFLTIRTPNTLNRHLLTTITSINHLPPSHNATISYPYPSPPLEFATCFWLRPITTSFLSSRCCT